MEVYPKFAEQNLSLGLAEQKRKSSTPMLEGLQELEVALLILKPLPGWCGIDSYVGFVHALHPAIRCPLGKRSVEMPSCPHSPLNLTEKNTWVYNHRSPYAC